MVVRAKFRVGSIKRYLAYNEKTQKSDLEVQTIEMYVVTDGSPENKAFFAFTPSGRIELGTVNKEAAAQFELNGEYYVDFIKAGE